MTNLIEKWFRNGIKWALEQWAADPITCVAIVGGQMNGYCTTHPQGDTYLRLTNDPSQVAGMLEFELKRCGIQLLVANPSLEKDLGLSSSRVRLFFKDTECYYTLSLQEGQKRLLKIFDVADNDAKGAQETAKLFV